MKLSVCSLFRREGPYLREWVEFHRMVGVDHFILYNDRSDDDWESALEPYRDMVEVIDFPLVGRVQMDAYADCLSRVKRGLLAVIDVDEFLWPVQHDTIQDAIASIPLPSQWGALGVQWMTFGSSGQTVYSPEPVIERFTWRPADNSYFNQWMKCIVNTEDPNIVPGHCDPHRFDTAWGTYNELGERTSCPTSVHTADVLRINHYFTKSRQEWEFRHPLEEPILGGKYPRDESRWEGVQAMDVQDFGIQRFLPELKKRLAQ